MRISDWSSDVCSADRDGAAKGFLYLVAIMDWWSRKVLAWRLSNTLDPGFCIEALDEAIESYGRPEILNTDQGSQFTSWALKQRLQEDGVRLSMDGRGRFLDHHYNGRASRWVRWCQR